MDEPPDVERPAAAAPTEEQLSQSPLSPRRGRRDPYSALRFRDYQLYSVGGLVAIIGNQVQGVAVGWELYERTRDPWSLGLVGLVQAAPVILLALPAGQIADRFDRRRIVLAMELLLMLCWLGLAALSYTRGPLLLFYGCLLLDGVAHTFAGPARSALLTQLVPPDVLPNAAIWNSSRWQIGSMIGPALGGGAVALCKIHTPQWGYAPVYGFAVLCSMVLMLFLLQLRPRPQQRESEPASWQTLLAGLRFVRDNKIILATITLDMFAVLLGGATTLLPVFASDILRVGPQGLGWLRAAPAVGALAMALALAMLPPLRRAGTALLWAVAGFGAATVVFGLSKNLWLSLAMLALTGALDNISVVVRHTLVQVLTPDHMRGRVSAVNSVFIGTSNELGGFESGAAAKLLGPVAAVVLGGVGTIAVVAFVARAWPQIRSLHSLEDAARQNTQPTSAEQQAAHSAT